MSRMSIGLHIGGRKTLLLVDSPSFRTGEKVAASQPMEKSVPWFRMYASTASSVQSRQVIGVGVNVLRSSSKAEGQGLGGSKGKDARWTRG